MTFNHAAGGRGSSRSGVRRFSNRKPSAPGASTSQGAQSGQNQNPSRPQPQQHNFSEPPGAQEPARRATVLTPEIAAAIPLSPFTELGLHATLVRAVLEEGYVTPSPVQKEVIPPALAGRDVLACAQTGTGKTAGFVLPIIQQLSQVGQTSQPGAPKVHAGTGPIRGLILCPTRELAIQIAERISAYGQHLGLRHTVIYGGVNQKRQEIALRGSPDIVVATPGRLLDLLQQNLVSLKGVTHFVLDEADRMLDMGFVHDVRRVVSYLNGPQSRQTLFFSATIAPPVEQLARTMLKDPFRVTIAPKVTTSESVEQSVVFVGKNDKRSMLMDILKDAALVRVLVFTRTKHGANRLCDQLDRAGVRSLAIHGNKAQNARERALEGFRSGQIRCLVATDVAARGIDVEGISLVVNYELPNIAESYVHRIGRTGRAAATGKAISFCDAEERAFLRDIEKFIRKPIPVLRMTTTPEASPPAQANAAAPRQSMQNTRTHNERPAQGGQVGASHGRHAAPPNGAPHAPAVTTRRGDGRPPVQVREG